MLAHPGVMTMEAKAVENETAGKRPRPYAPIQAPAVEPILVTVRAAAGALGISDRTLWRLVLEGHLPSVKILGRRMVSVDDLKAYVARQRETPATAAA